MNTESFTATVGLLGVVIGAGISAITQWATSRQAIKAERERLHEQMHGEARLRRAEQWRTELRQSLASLLAACDPEPYSMSVPRERIVQMTHAVDLLLQQVPEQEALRRAVIELSTYVTGIGSEALVSRDARLILALQDAVYKTARVVLRETPEARTD